MRKRGRLQTILSLLLAVSLIVGLMPAPLVAKASEPEKITAYELSKTEMSVSAGTNSSDIKFPQKIKVTLEGGTEKEIPVTWDDGGSYKKDKAGSYKFTADFGTSYTYKDKLPSITVTVKEAAPTPEPASEPEKAPEQETEPAKEPAKEEEASESSYANKISGFVWADKVLDGVYKPQDEVEANREWAIEGWEISLLKADDQSVAAKVKTDKDGKYEFKNIKPGTYVVKPHYNTPDTDNYRRSRLGLVGQNKIVANTGTTEVMEVKADSDIQGVDIGMKVKPGYMLKASYNIDLPSATVPISGPGYTWGGIVNNNGRIIFDTTANGHTYTITRIGMAVSYRFIIQSGVKIKIILKDFESVCYEPILELQGNSEVDLELQGTNRFRTVYNASTWTSGMLLKNGSKLTIDTTDSNASLWAEGRIGGAGIGVEYGATLVINNGKVRGSVEKQWANIGGAGIGGYSGVNAGNIIINGGEVTATTEGYAAGIGGGYGGAGGNVTVNGGTVTASTTNGGAGIGGGAGGLGGSVTINGGKVTASTNAGGAGIGAGTGAKGLSFAISGGEVTATTNGGGAAIGGGKGGTHGGTITIDGGSIQATSQANGAAIGGGESSDHPGVIKINGGYTVAKVTGTGQAAGIGGGSGAHGGNITITGGWVEAQGASTSPYDIGGPVTFSGSSKIVFTGGSIQPLRGETYVEHPVTNGPVNGDDPVGMFTYTRATPVSGDTMVRALGTLQNYDYKIPGTLPSHTDTLYLWFMGGIVETKDATNIKKTTSDINGSYLLNVDSIDKMFFEWSTTPGSYPAANTVNLPIGSLTGKVNTNAPLTGLTPNTKYYFRYGMKLTANGITNTFYGVEKSFTTLPNISTASQKEGSSNTKKDVKATLTGGNETITGITIYYEKDTVGPVTTSSPSVTLSGTGSQSYDYTGFDAADVLTGLTAGATYNLLIVVKNASGSDSYYIYSSAPNIAGELASGPNTGNPLASNTWTNQNVTVKVTCPSPDIAGSHFNALYKGTTQEAKGASAHSAAQKTYSAETAGTSLTGVQVDSSDNETSGYTKAYIVKIDKTKPVGNLQYNAGTPDHGFTDKSTDTASAIANSDINASKTKVAIVAHGAAEPAASAYVSITGAQIANDNKYYDVWVIATDNAGNESVPVKALDHISYNGKDEIKAKDFAFAIKWGSAYLTDGMAKMLSFVEATYEGGGAVPLSSIDVDTTQLNAIKTAIGAGKTGTVWPLKFKTQGANSSSVTINVTLYDEGSTPNPPPGPLTHELIYANDFKYTIDNGAISANDAKTLAKVTAYDKNGAAIPKASLTVDTTELKAINDSIAADSTNGGTPLPLTFKTPDGTSVTIKVTLDELTKSIVTVKYENRDGGTIKTATTIKKLPGSSYTAPASAITGYVFVDWKQDSGLLRGNTTPTIIVPSTNTTITLVYGDDLVDGSDNPGNDSIEDFKITKKYETAGGTTIKISETKSVNKGKAFKDTHAAITGYTYEGHKVDGGSLVSGEPNVTVSKKHVVTYIYKLNSYKVTVKYQDRDGNTLKADTSANVNHGSSYTAVPLAIADHIFADWKQDSGSLKGNTTPIITNVTKATTITLVYGDDLVDGNNDPGSDGIEDFKITKKFETAGGTKLQADQTKQINKGKTFADTHASITGYSFQGHKIDGGSQVSGDPSFIVSKKQTVTYIYGAASFTITIKYQDRDGSQIQSDMTTSKTYGSSFTANAPAITGYIFVDWKQDSSALMGNTTPKITVPAKNTTIILVYGDDHVDGNNDPGSDGVEDFKITKKYETAGGTTIKADVIKSINKGKTFADAHDTITGYTYQGYKLGSSSLQTGEPGFLVTGKQTVTYVYGITTYKVTVKYQDRDGVSIEADFSTTKNHGSSYTATAPSIANYMFVDWKQDNGSLKGNTSPTIANITKDTTITLVYGDDSVDGNDDPGSDGIEDFKITKKYETAGGASVKAMEIKSLNKGKTFADTHPTVTGFDYKGYKIGGGTLQTGDPTFTVSKKETVTYIYQAAGLTVTTEYVDRDGNTIQTPSIAVAIYDTTYTAAVPAITGYIFVDWKQDGGALKGNKTPSIKVPATNTTITLVYGHDKIDGNGDPGSDGIEDFPITRKYQKSDGTTLKADDIKYVNKGKTYADTHADISGYAYKGYKLGSGTQTTGEPSFTVSGKQTVTYVYGEADIKVTIQYQDRDGKTIKTADTLAKPYNSSLAVPVPSIKNYIFVDWKQDSSALKGNKTPKITVPAKGTTVTLVYGQDKGGGGSDGKDPDGIEDVTITESHRNGLGSKLCADTETYVNLGDTYTGKTNATLLGLGYVYEGYTWDSDPEVPAPALPTKMGIMTKHTVVYRYSPNEYPINVTYEFKDGTALSGSQKELIVHGKDFTKSSTPKLNVPTFSEKTLVNWKLDGTLMNNTNPGLTNVTRYHDIILIYGQDKGGGGSDGKTPDGIEDFTITEKFTDGSNNTLASARSLYVNKGTTYTGTPKKITGFTYKSYTVDGGAAVNGTPTVKNIQADHEVAMIYGVAEYRVVVKAVNTAGKSIQNGAYDWTDTVKHKDSYAMKIPAIKNMKFQYWTLNGTKQGGKMIEIASVEANAAVKLYYASVEPADKEDYSNYEFVKTPNIKTVKPGQAVTYTFSGFANKYPVALNNFCISDTPDKGLDFKGASLPAFTKGAGVTYDVVYYTNKQEAVKLYTNVPADKAFSFKMPKLGSGEYVTGITFKFGTVPSGFAKGDTFTMDFRVWNNPPAKSLKNIGMLTYDVNGEARKFITGSGAGSVYLSGWFTAAKTGDTSNPLPLIFLLIGAAALIGTTVIVRRRKKFGSVEE